MLPNREGLFNAYPVDIGIGETRENKLLQVVIGYHLFEELVNGGWVDCCGENLEITGYHILECRDHSLNQRTIEALKTALGWDGRDPFWLQDSAAELAQKPVQVRIGFEEYNGTTRPRVQFLNPYGSKPAGVTKAGNEARRHVTNRLGAKFRALAGGSPTNAPAPSSKPAAPKAPAATAPPPAACSMDDAWSAFCAAYEQSGPDGTPGDREQQWFSAISQLFPGRQPDQLTPADWGVMRKQGSSLIVPF